MLQVTFLGSGSGGNATLLQHGATRVLLDCGFAPRELAARLARVGVSADLVDALFITHEHSDHVAGLPLFAKRPGFPVHLTARTARAIGFGRQALCSREHITPGRSTRVGDLEVLPFSISHDARDPVGYVVGAPDGRRVGFATDLGYAAPAAVEALTGCDLLGLEANHDLDMLRAGPYPGFLKRRIRSRQGHLSNPAAAELLGRVAGPRLRHLFALHVSQVNNRPALARGVLEEKLRSLGLRVPVTVVEQDQSLSYPPAGQLDLF